MTRDQCSNTRDRVPEQWSQCIIAYFTQEGWTLSMKKFIETRIFGTVKALVVLYVSNNNN